MKIRIDGSGNLEIERGGTFKDQYCPHQDVGTSSEAGLAAWCRCGDWSPLFGEPEDEMGCMKPLDTECTSWATGCERCQHYGKRGMRLTLCQEHELTGTIEDMRRSA